ncbi:hypothetical protein SERLA73DRAFT_144851 [Serpula lacrymans var. lacrymans S7.3]|uniref:Uncharacterized protein n=2 Tax=Serpula lacrymans var. lacrymans TaxID=341189 RepID=F8QCH8_SERL3|nr:uncharacterized protein SERLADRAFT_402543 [Serpula lacrymans var. lacrymans S7.9]EGN93843.1 hypothetical protein SERLA73DRAFT_144851 [Serpula lacrymans var. lacrymans S7.3]EGO19210.1 hypothetical protein SERLADRAFT_402543 [Serpula lacrymans var. lacrymans S7.9]
MAMSGDILANVVNMFSAYLTGEKKTTVPWGKCPRQSHIVCKVYSGNCGVITFLRRPFSLLHPISLLKVVSWLISVLSCA